MFKILERKNTPLLGDSKRADAIVKWSLSKADGTKFASDPHLSGITLESVAKGSSPRVFLYFNAGKLKQEFLQISGLDRLVLNYKGICVRVERTAVTVDLICLPKKLSRLWSGDIAASVNHNLLLGMIELSEDGFNFYAPSECESKSERVEPLAVISKKPLSQRTKTFLAKDAILNIALMKSGSLSK